LIAFAIVGSACGSPGDGIAGPPAHMIAFKNFFPMLNGGDAAILYCFIFLLFFVAGSGQWSLDAKLMRVGYGDRRIRSDRYGEVHASQAGE
jgi:hypothetical protein